jgi:hypothetical protein
MLSCLFALWAVLFNDQTLWVVDLIFFGSIIRPLANSAGDGKLDPITFFCHDITPK